MKFRIRLADGRELEVEFSGLEVDAIANAFSNNSMIQHIDPAMLRHLGSSFRDSLETLEKKHHAPLRRIKRFILREPLPFQLILLRSILKGLEPMPVET